MKQYFKKNPNTFKENALKEIKISYDYNRENKVYYLFFRPFTREKWGERMRLDGVPRSAVLAFVSRKSAKVEAILDKWLEENLDGLFRQYVWIGGDNMYGVVKYIEEHKPEGVNLPEIEYKYRPKAGFQGDYMPCSDTWEVLGNCGTDCDSIKEKYKELESLYSTDYEKFTDLVLNVDHLCWMWYDGVHEDVSRVFADLYYHSKDKFYELFGCNSVATDYFFEVTD